MCTTPSPRISPSLRFGILNDLNLSTNNEMIITPLNKAMVTLRLALNQIAREFPALREGVIVSDKCSSFQTYEQIVFVIQGNSDGWATTEYPIPTSIRIVAWQHTESQAGKDTLDTHYAFISLAHEKYLRFDGDIINPTDMFNATSKYAPINTSVILANTSHALIRKYITTRA
jgi:hypothetical protein